MTEPSFKEEFSKLNPSQKEASLSVEGPSMVIAGPGTGKTQVLALRIANILLQTQLDPKNILALTFTESGVITMRKRLIEIIGHAAYYVQIHTFHSFCEKAIREFPEKFIFSRDLRPMTDVDRVLCLQEIIDKAELEHLVSFHNRHFFLNAISEAICSLKRENVRTTDFDALVLKKRKDWDKEKSQVSEKSLRYIQNEKEICKLEELSGLYSAYQALLAKKGMYDFEDMILFVVEKMEKDKEFLRYYQELFQYVLVDEYQDTNNAQNELCRLLCSFWETPNIFVVGDDDQAIFRFQGASVENLLYFSKLYPNIKKTVLDKNYRSSQLILDAAGSLIEKNEQRICNIEKSMVKKLKAEKKIPDNPIEFYEFEQGENENVFLVEKIKALQKSGVKLDEIAVFVKENKDYVDIVDAFERHSIPYFLRGGTNVLHELYIRKILKLLRLINDPFNDVLFFEVLLFDFMNIPAVDAYKMIKEAKNKKERLSSVCEDLMGKISDWKKASANMTFVEFFEYLIKTSGYLEYILRSERKIDILNKTNSFFSFVRSMNNSDHELNIKSFLKKLDVMEENNLMVEEYVLKPENEAVQVMTAHKAKGLEFEYVFLPKLYDRKWGNKSPFKLIKLPEELLPNTDLGKKEQNEDDRRLFYVAMTRAKKQIFMSYAKLYHTFGTERETVPSIFISEIDGKFLKKCDVGAYQKDAEKLLSFQFKDKDIMPQELSSYLETLIDEFKLSTTALDTYLECKRKFLYNNLLRVPRVKTKALSFGTAVHKAFELFFSEFKKKNLLPSKEFLLKKFEIAMKREVLTQKETEEALKKGIKVLSGYYDYYQKEFKTPMFLEYFFGTHNVYLGDVPLTGKLDRIDLLDTVSRKVHVTDYKTGRQRSRNDIEGKTKSSDGRYKRQLNFYKILCDSDKNFPFDVVSGEFDFVEPSKTGKYKKEQFNFDDKEIRALKGLISKTYKEMRSGDFTKTDNKSPCKKCEYKDICGR